MKIRTSRSGFCAGFTLIELMIAITLLALLATILYSAFYLGHRAIEKAQGRSEESQRLRIGRDFLGAYIRSAHPYKSSPSQVGYYFFGEPSSLTFVSAFSAGMGGRGMSLVTISWNGTEGGPGAFTLEEEMPVRPNADEAGGGYKTTVVIGEEVRNFRMDYLDPQTQEVTWEEEWDAADRNILPQAVRISYLDRRGEEIEWVFPVIMRAFAP